MKTKDKVEMALFTALGILGSAWFMFPHSLANASLAARSKLETTSATATLVEEGQKIFRFDTFGDEDFWGGTLGLHKALSGERLGGTGSGVSPKAALSIGLKVDAAALPANVVSSFQAGTLDLDSPETTLSLLKLNAVVGVKGFFDEGGRLSSVGIQCAFCHATVDDSLAPGIGQRRDGWPNRDLNIGAIVSLAPDLKFFADALQTDDATVRTVLQSWGPGRYDAQLLLDGKAFRPDGKTASTILPPAYGLLGMNLHTYTGFGSVPYWNAYVAVTQMHGKGNFYDQRLADANQFPVSARTGLYHTRHTPDLVSSKLAALQAYQLSLAAPTPPKDSFDADAATRGKAIFEGKARCASCHVPPLFTEPGHNLHRAEEIGIDSFQSDRSPARGYRTTPLRGLWSHQKGGFYHDGRFETLERVIDHYDGVFRLQLNDKEKADLRQYLLSL